MPSELEKLKIVMDVYKEHGPECAVIARSYSQEARNGIHKIITILDSDDELENLIAKMKELQEGTPAGIAAEMERYKLECLEKFGRLHSYHA